MKNVILLVCLVATGCMVQPNCQPPALWAKDGATRSQFYSDKYICAQQSLFNRPEDPVGLNWESFNDCMKAAGYVPVAED